MPWWLLLIIIVGSAILHTWYRAPRSQARPMVRPPREMDDYSPRSERPPLPARRRMQPPPLPRQRAVEVLEVVPIAAPPKSAPPPAPSKASVAVEKTPRSASVGQLTALLKDQKSLRAAILLREVLDAPLCKRRR